MAFGCFENYFSIYGVERFKLDSMGEVHHLLDLIHRSMLPILPTMKEQRKLELTGLIRCVTELRETGITFKKS